MTTENKEAAYWNEEGGERWVENIERLESMLAKLSEHLIKAVAGKPGERALDIGCGGGVTSAAVAADVGSSGHVTGVDISEVILTVARSRYAANSNLEFLTADAGAHDFADHSFDVVTSRFGVMFFPEPQAAFSKIFTAIKPGGRMVFMCWQGLAENPWMAEPVAAAFSVLPAPEKSDPNAPGPFSLADPEKLKRIMSGAGFKDIVISPVGETVNLGGIEPAVEFMTKLGPAAEPFRQANDSDRAAALVAMTAALEPYKTAQGVLVPGAVWIVEGSA